MLKLLAEWEEVYEECISNTVKIMSLQNVWVSTQARKMYASDNSNCVAVSTLFFLIYSKVTSVK